MNNEILKRILSSSILIPIALFFIIKGSILFLFFISICFLIVSYEWHMMSKNKTYYFYGFIFLIFSFLTIYFLQTSDYRATLLVAAICVSTDIGGYVFGKLFKGPKLTKISPNKTYSGMIGSFFLSIITIYLFKINIFTFVLPDTFFQLNNLNDFNLLLLVLFISTISQIGDLIISYFKRLSKIKNTGNLIPGHGGLLDRVDGIIFAIPASYILFKALS